MKTMAFRFLPAALFVSMALGCWGHPGHLRITEVNPPTGQVEVTNTGPIEFTTTSDLPFCHRFDYASSIPSGTTFIIGETRVFSVSGLNATDSDLWLYRNSNFADPSSIITGLKYGPEADVGRTSVAVAAGIWPAEDAFVPAPASGESLQIISYGFTAPENWGSGPPSLGSFYGDGMPISNPLPDISKGDLVVELETIAEGLVSPLGMAVPDDGTGRLFVYEQTGQILVIENGRVLATPLLDVSGRLASLGASYDEKGLLGVALHPNFAINGKIYTYTSEPVSGAADFTTPGGVQNHQSVVAAWEVSVIDANVIDVSSRRGILRIDQPQGNHNGGDLHFGPDGMLYIAVGDGGSADDQGGGHSPSGNAQDKNNVYGTILRIDVGGNNAENGQYGIPPDNPFVGEDGVDEVYAYGFRNPYHFSFDRVTGELYVGDVGQNDVEEIDIVASGGNYGWRLKEGSFFFDPNGGDAGFATTLPLERPPQDLMDPIAEYDHDDGAAVIGGFVYRGTAIPSLAGRYLFGDWGTFGTPSGRLLYLDDTREVREIQIGEEDRVLGLWVKSLGEDANGELYVLGSEALGPSGTTGKVLKIVPLTAPRFDIAAIHLADSELHIDFTSTASLAEHHVESRQNLGGGNDWSEIPASLEQVGSTLFRATLTPSAGGQAFYRIVVGDR